MVKIMDAIKINKIIERPDCAKIYGVFDCEENPSLISGDPVLCLRGDPHDFTSTFLGSMIGMNIPA